MKIAESWLREWVNPDLDTEALSHQLTMLGHEVDGVEYEGVGIADIVIAEVTDVSKHPDADKLSLCKVDDGSGELIDVVCGAPNVVKGMKTPFARPGVKLPNGMKLRKAKIRGVVSNGMLCSAVEIGLGDESDGIVVDDDIPAVCERMPSVPALHPGRQQMITRIAILAFFESVFDESPARRAAARAQLSRSLSADMPEARVSASTLGARPILQEF